MPSLADIPFLGGYTQQDQMNRAQEGNQLAQAGALQGLLAKMQAAQQEQAFRAKLAQLGPNPSQDALAQLAAKFSTAKDILTSQTASADRKAALEAANIRHQSDREQRAHDLEVRGQQRLDQIEAAAREGRLTRAEADKHAAATRESMIRLTAALRPPPQQRNLQLTADAEGNQLIVNPDGTTTPLTTQNGEGVKKSVTADKPMTEFQGKAALYGTRAAQSDKVLKSLEDNISTAGLSAGQATGVVGNMLMSSEQRRVDQAQRDFVNAVLRQESGAVISDAEFANAKKQYFPQPGDDKNTVAQKRANRQLAIQGFARMSGPKGAVDIKAVIDNPLLPGVSGTKVAPQENSGTIGVANILEQADAILKGKK